MPYGTAKAVPFHFLLSCPLHVFQVDAFFCHLIERREFTEAFNGFDDAVRNVVDFSFGVEAADAETNGTVRQIVAGAESLQYIRWLQRRRGASRSAGNCDVVDAHEQRFALDVGEADVQVARQAMVHRAVDVDLVQLAHDAVAQTVAQTCELTGLLRHFFLSNGTRLAQTDDAGDVERAGAHAALVAAAIDDGGNLHARILAANIERAHALGTVHLVAGDGGQIDVLLDHVDGNLADGLSGVGVKDHAALMTQLADLRHGLENANLVIGEHDRHQDGFVIHGALQVVEVNETVFLHRHVGDAVAILLQALAGVEHGLVLGDRGDDVIALLAVHLGDTLDGKVVALSRAGGEDDLFGGGANQLGNALARSFDALFGRPSERVIAAGRVAEFLHEIGQHLFQHPRIHGGGGVVIHVDGQLHILAIRGVHLGLCLGDSYIRAHWLILLLVFLMTLLLQRLN